MAEDFDKVARASEDFTKLLNRSGYGFQAAVWRRLQNIPNTMEWSWRREVPEFPVVAGTETTHVDIVMMGVGFGGPSRAYLVGECKRVNPAFSRWCFARMPDGSDEIVLDRFSRSKDDELSHHVFPNSDVLALPIVKDARKTPYNLGLELKQGDSDNSGTGRGAINEATAQVLRATSGLINHLASFAIAFLVFLAWLFLRP
jgi:hypothetical protein